MNLAQACVSKSDVAYAALDGVSQLLDEFQLKLDFESDNHLYEKIYDALTFIELQTIR